VEVFGPAAVAVVVARAAVLEVLGHHVVMADGAVGGTSTGSARGIAH